MKTYRINARRLALELAGALVLLSAAVYAVLVGTLTGGRAIYIAIILVASVVGMAKALSTMIVKLEIKGKTVTIFRLLAKPRRIELTTVKDFSVAGDSLSVTLYFIDNSASAKLILLYLDKTDRHAICEAIAEIMSELFCSYSDQRIDSLYNNARQYDFSATERHIPLYIMLIIFWGVQTLILLTGIVAVLVAMPRERSFAVFEAWYVWGYIPLSWGAICLLDTVIPKRTLTCKNGTICCRRKDKTLFEFRIAEAKDCRIDYKSFTWTLCRSPKKERAISLMGFAARDKQMIRNKLELLITFRP